MASFSKIKKSLLLGGGNAAVEEAIFLTKFAIKLYLFIGEISCVLKRCYKKN
jgi:thioredoxin reductase